MRERVFDLIAQELGVSCQSCVFLTLPERAEPLRQAPRAEVYQGAITYIPRHGSTPCRANCALEPWLCGERPASWVRFLAEGRIKNATDLFVGNILGYVCGAYERLEFVISTRHQLFLVDNEYTLLNPPDVPERSNMCVRAAPIRIGSSRRRSSSQNANASQPSPTQHSRPSQASRSCTKSSASIRYQGASRSSVPRPDAWREN